jgi:hypothetical protein
MSETPPEPTGMQVSYDELLAALGPEGVLMRIVSLHRENAQLRYELKYLTEMSQQADPTSDGCVS